MRIAIFTDTYLPDINGVATSVHVLKNELVKRHHDVLIVTTTLPKGSDYIDYADIVRVSGLDLKCLYGYRMAPLYSLSAMGKIKRFKPDIIHTQTEFGIGLFGRIVGQVLNIPIVYTFHTMWYDYTHYVTHGIKPLDLLAKKGTIKVSRLYADKCGSVIVPSSKAKKALIDYGVTNHIYIAPTGLELNRFYHVDEEKVSAIKDQYHLHGKFVVGFLGRLASEKSVDFIFDALRPVLLKDAHTVMLVVGDGPDTTKLKAYVKKLGLERKVIFTGAKDIPDVPAYYHAFSLFVSASHTETQGLTYIEAMASGLPILARYDRNLENVIVNGRNGYYFKKKEELAELVDRLKNADLTRLSENALDDSRKFNSEAFGEKVEHVYQETAERYMRYYKVKSIKESGQKYILTLKYMNEDIKIKITKADLAKYQLAPGKDLEISTAMSLLESDRLKKCYNMALKYLSYHDYSTVKLRKKLIDKQYDEAIVDEVIQLLLDKGLLDDYEFAINKIQHYLNNGYGLKKATYQLQREGLSEKVITQAVGQFDEDDELQQAIALIQKLYHKNTTRSPSAFFNSVKATLYRKGYSENVINKAIDQCEITFTDEETNELLTREYQRLIQRYRRKYQGSELNNKIISALIQKGYAYPAIKAMMEDQEEGQQ